MTTRFALILTASVLPSCASPGAQHPGVPRDEQRARTELLDLAAQMRVAIETRNVDAVLRLIHQDGIPCGDATVPRATVEAQLRPGGGLHAYLFEPKAYPLRGRPLDRPMSLREFFERATDVVVDVGFDDDGRGGKDLTSGCARYRAANLEFTPHFCFQKIGGRWFLSRGLSCE